MAGPWVALFLHDLTNNYQLLLREDAQRTARRYDHTVSVYSGEKDSAAQVAQIQSVLDQNESLPSAILVCPVRESALAGVARAAVAKGVPWVLLCRWSSALRDIRRESPAVPVFAISADQLAIGRIQGEYVKLLLRPDDEVVYIRGPAGTSTAEKRLASTRAELRDVGAHLSLLYGDWSAESGAAAMRSWLQTTPHRRSPNLLVVAQNDNMAFGARKALVDSPAERAALESARIIGCDGVPNFGQRMVVDGLLAATVVVPSVAGRALERILSSGQRASATPEEVLVEVRGYPESTALAHKYARAAAQR